VVDGTHLVEPCEVADAFAIHFHFIYNNPSPGIVPSLSSSSEFLSISRISDSDIFKAHKRLKPSKSVGINNIPSFVIRGCSGMLVPVLKHIFNLSLSQHFPTSWKQTVIVPVFKKGNSASVSNYKPI
jgi:hypothetical protein